MAAIGNMAKIPELRARILFTVAMIGVFRLGVHIPIPGIDPAALEQFFESQRGTFLEFYNLFTGGALERFSIFALGIMPYISASIILQLLTVVFPHLERLQKEGEMGRKKITQYTRYLTIVIAAIQAFGMVTLFVGQQASTGVPLVANPGLAFKIQAIATLAAGTGFLMWLGEQMTERGVGNGISLLIFAGIVAGFPSAVMSTVELFRSGELGPLPVLGLLAFMILVIYFIVFCEQAQRRIPVQYAKRVVGRRMVQGQSTYLPLKLNIAGVIPPIFASSLLMFPVTIASFTNAEWLRVLSDQLQIGGGWLYNTIFVVLIIFFCFFYTAIQFNVEDVADNMKKFGGYIPGIRPGAATAQFIEKVVERLTLVGSIYVSAICVLPMILQSQVGISFYFGGTSLLIVVGVALDTIAQIESHLLTHHYEGFLGPRASRIKGRRG